MSRPKKRFNLTQTPKKAHWGPKKPKTTRKYGPQKAKNDPKIRSTLKVRIKGA